MYTGKEDYAFGDVTKKTVDHVSYLTGLAKSSENDSIEVSQGQISEEDLDTPSPPKVKSETEFAQDRNKLVDSLQEGSASSTDLMQVFSRAFWSPRIQHTVVFTPAEIIETGVIWDSFFDRAYELSNQCLQLNVLIMDDFVCEEPFLYMGLPSLIVIEVVHRSLDCTDGFILSTGMKLTADNCPEKHRLLYACMQASKARLERVKRGYISQNLETIHQLQQRLSSVELERETAILKMEGIYSDYLQVKEQLEQEQKQTQTDKQNSKHRQESLHSQIGAQKEDQLRLNRQLEELKSNLKESHLDLDTCERKCTLKIQSLTKQFKAKEGELQARFDGTESSHREATSELRNLLSSHQRLGAKWKGETKTITERFENAAKKLKEENSKLKRSNEELKSEVVQSKLEQQSIVCKLRNLESLRDNFQDRVDELEDRNDQYSQQLTKYMTKERQWEQEQKILSNHLTRLQIQSSHSKLKSKGSRIMTAPSDKLKSDFVTSANLPPPIFSSTSSINKAIQSPNILSEPFLHFENSSNGDSSLSIQTND